MMITVMVTPNTYNDADDDDDNGDDNNSNYDDYGNDVGVDYVVA